MNHLSIIITALRGSEALEETLLSVLENRPDDSEIIVVHSGFYQDPYNLQEEVQFVEAPHARQAADCLNLGVTYASGEFLHTLESGLSVEAGWTDAALALFDDQRTFAVSPVIRENNSSRQATGVSIDNSGIPVIQTGTNGGEITGPWHGAGFYQSDLLHMLGGFNSSLGDLFADADLAAIATDLDLVCRVAGNSQVTLSGKLPRATINFAAATKCKRLQARHLGLCEDVSAVSRWFSILGHTAGSLPRLGALTHVLGQMIGSSTLKRQDRIDLDAIGAELESYLERSAILQMVMFTSANESNEQQGRAKAA
ncbi:MAG: glycosyltransferase [Pirellulales bacterium]